MPVPKWRCWCHRKQQLLWGSQVQYLKAGTLEEFSSLGIVWGQRWHSDASFIPAFRAKWPLNRSSQWWPVPIKLNPGYSPELSPALPLSLGLPQKFLSQRQGQRLPPTRPEVWSDARGVSAQESVDLHSLILSPLSLQNWNQSLQGSFLKTFFFKSLKICIILSVTIYSFCISSNWHCCYFGQARKEACQELTWCVMSPKQKCSHWWMSGWLLCGFPPSSCKWELLSPFPFSVLGGWVASNTRSWSLFQRYLHSEGRRLMKWPGLQQIQELELFPLP